jgi:Plavaka transposase
MDVDLPPPLSPIHDFIPPQPELPELPPSLPPPLTATGRPYRQHRLPRRFTDNLPEALAPAPTHYESQPESGPAGPVRRVLLIVRDRLVTAANSFGVWREYPHRPSIDPDGSLSLEELSNSHRVLSNSCEQSPAGPPPLSPDSPDSERPFYWPCQNATIWRVMAWLNNGKTAKSEAEATSFVETVVHASDFNKDELIGFNAHRENQRLDKALSGAALKSQFSESSVDILVPSGDPKVPAKTFSVPGLFHRNLTSVIVDAFNDPLSHLLHLSPFKLFCHNPLTRKEERIYGELYTSDAFLAEHEEVQQHGKLPSDDLSCHREKAVAALMISSDATHLTNFGNTKAWPFYLMLGNLSKYFRSLPNSGAMHHLAYIPSVSNLEF